MTGPRLRAFGVVVAVYVLAVLAFHPFGDVFYGGDDWAYGWSVGVLLEQGKLRAASWVTAAAVPQTFWAAGFCKILGLHPWVLNLATLVASVIGVVLLQLLGVTLGLSPLGAGLMALLVALEPLYLGFAGSFMSDMYYAVLLIAALLVYVGALRNGSLRMAFLGGALASLAFLNRQIGMALPAAFVGAALSSWLVRRETRSRAALTAVTGASLPLLVIAAYRRFPDAFGGETTVQRLKMSSAKLWERMAKVELTASHAYAAMVYVGILIAPLVIVLLSGPRSRQVLGSRRWRVPFVLLLLVSLWQFVTTLREGGAFVVRGEFLQTGSFGAPPLALMEPLWKGLAFVGSVALPVVFVLIVERFVSGVLAARGREGTPEGASPQAPNPVPELVFLSLCFAAHLFLVASFIAFYNNYFLPLVVLAAALVCVVHGGDAAYAARRMAPLGASLVALTALGSILVLDSHVRYVEADARVAESLVAAGANSREVFGYPSWYAWRHYDIVAAEIERHVWGPLERIRKRATTLILNPEQRPGRPGFRRVRSDAYRTLLGERRIDVWERR